MKTTPHPDHLPNAKDWHTSLDPRWLVFAVVGTALFLAVAACKLQGSAGSSKGQAGDPALQFLHYFPDQPEYRKFVAFGDAAAWHTSWNVPRIASAAELKNSTDTSFAYWLGIMPNQTLPPECLDLNYIYSYSLKDTYGFDLFGMDRYIYAGQPPKIVSVLEFRSDRQAIADALTAKGYSAQELAPGWVLYSLNEDYALNVQAKMHAEQMGNLNRILLSDHFMIVGKATEVVAPALEAGTGKTPSLADDNDYIASVQALKDPSLKDAGELVGVIWVDGKEFTSPDYFFGQKSEAAISDLAAKYGLNSDLPAYSLAAFATRHSLKDKATYLILALVFPKGTDAEAASQVLQDRLEKADSLAANKPFLEVMNATDVKVYAVQAGGLPVTLAVFHLDDPEPKALTEGSRPTARVRSWFDFVAKRDLMFLYTRP
jgi:hypothetical protein